MSSKKDSSPQGIFGRSKVVEKGKSSPGKFDTSSSSYQHSPQELVGRHNHDYGMASFKDNSTSQSTVQETHGKDYYFPDTELINTNMNLKEPILITADTEGRVEQ
ncbi:hypothetical protein ACLB2K_026249 [Fragaria x ananassa]